MVIIGVGVSPCLEALAAGPEAEAPIITADTLPTLAALDSDDTPADGYTPGSYSSTAGTISSAVATYYVNGSEAAGDTDLATGDTVYVSALVTDSEGNTRVFFTGSVTVTEELGSGSFQMSDLGSDLILFLDPSDLSTLKQDRAGTTAVTAHNDPVRYADVGGGYEAIAPTDNQYLTYQTDGTRHWLKFDSGRNSMLVVSGLSGLTTTMAVFEASSSSGSLSSTAGSSGGFVGLRQIGSTSSPHSSAGSPVYRVDGVARSSPTRGDLQSAMGADDSLLTSENVDMSSWTDIAPLEHPTNGSINYSESVYAWALTKALSTTNRNNVESLFAGKAGVTVENVTDPAAYSTADFTDGGGYSITTVAANGNDTDITMTGPSGTKIETFTDAELESAVCHNVVPPEITESPADTYTATDGGGWFWDDTQISDPEFQLAWKVNDAVVASGTSWTKGFPAAQDYQKITFVVTPEYGDSVEILVQAATTYDPNAITTNDGSLITYSGAGALADVVVVAFSATIPPDLDGTTNYPLVVGGCKLLLNSGATNFQLRDEDGTLLGNWARAGQGSGGETLCAVILAEKDGTLDFAFRDTSGFEASDSNAMPAGKRLGTGGDCEIGVTAGSLYNFVQHRAALWASASMPSRTAGQLLDDLFGPDCKPLTPEIGNAYLGTPRWDVKAAAAIINTGAQDGSWAGTGTLSGGSGFVDV